MVTIQLFRLLAPEGMSENFAAASAGDGFHVAQVIVRRGHRPTSILDKFGATDMPWLLRRDCPRRFANQTEDLGEGQTTGTFLHSLEDQMFAQSLHYAEQCSSNTVWNGNVLMLLM